MMSHCSNRINSTDQNSSWRAFFSAWESASQQFRYGAFWFWNDELELAVMQEKIRLMAEHHLRYVILHPIHGLEVEYLSDAYCEKFRMALELLAEAGLQAMIYDEFAWPSGNVGGKLLAAHPEFNAWILSLEESAPGAGVSATMTQCRRILDSVTGAAWCRNEPGTLDTLNADAVDCFLSMTHERLYQAAGAELFQRVVIGVFTDEPTMLVDNDTTHSLWETNDLPWSPGVPEAFFERYHYRVEDHYAELVANHPSKVRRDYFTLIETLHAENFFGRIRHWCDQHHVAFTGHIGEDFPAQAARFSGNVRAVFAQFTIPGIDYLGHPVPAAERMTELTLVESLAHADDGKKRILCEAFGVSSHTLAVEKMLRESSALALHGINDQALMGIHQTQRGIRKHLYWPPLFETSPQFLLFDELMARSRRMISLLSAGRKITHCAILYPGDHLRQLPIKDYPRCGEGELVQQTLRKLLCELNHKGGGAEYLFGEDLASATLNAKGQIQSADGRCFDRLLVSKQFYYEPETLQALERFAAVTISEVERLAPALETAFFAGVGKAESPLELQVRTFEDARLLILQNNSSWEVTEQLVIPEGKTLFLLNGEVAAGTRGQLRQLHDREFVSIAPEALATLLVVDSWELAEALLAIAERDAFMPGERLALTDYVCTLSDGNDVALDRVVFRNPAGVVLPGESGGSAPRTCRIPEAFAGETRFEFRGEFTLRSNEAGEVPDLTLDFERTPMRELALDGNMLAWENASGKVRWSEDAVSLALGKLAPGRHEIRGVLEFPRYETTMRNDGFFQRTPMPSLDCFLHGAFRVNAQNELEAFPKAGMAGRLPYLPAELGVDGAFAGTTLHFALPEGARNGLFQAESSGAGSCAWRGEKLDTVSLLRRGEWHKLDGKKRELTLHHIAVSAALFGAEKPHWCLSQVVVAQDNRSVKQDKKS